jgi:hypothetical protein
MAGVFFTMTTGEVSLIAATAKTVIEVAAAANHRCLIHEIRVMFKGTTVANEPVTIEEIQFTGSGTGSAGTARKRMVDDSETLQTGFEYNHSAEPTGITVVSNWYIHPQSGIVQPLPINRPIPVPGGDFWGIRCTADDAVTVGVHIEAEE